MFKEISMSIEILDNTMTDFYDSGLNYVSNMSSSSSIVDTYQNILASIDSPVTSQQDNKLDVTIPAKRRKRVRQEEKWKKNIRKASRAEGKSYITRKGKYVAAKVFSDPECDCSKKCHLLFSTDEKKKVFDDFYSLKNFNSQTAFIWGQVKVMKKSRVYTHSAQSKRTHSRIYYLPRNGEDIKVCSIFFKKLLLLSDGRLARALKNKKDETSEKPPEDSRGKSSKQKKINEDLIEKVKQFIGKFPTYSNCSRPKKSVERKYLVPNLNVIQ